MTSTISITYKCTSVRLRWNLSASLAPLECSFNAFGIALRCASSFTELSGILRLRSLIDFRFGDGDLVCRCVFGGGASGLQGTEADSSSASSLSSLPDSRFNVFLLRYISIAHSIRKWQISTVQGAKTPELILMKLGMVDYVRDSTLHDNFGGGIASWVVLANMRLVTSLSFFSFFYCFLRHAPRSFLDRLVGTIYTPKRVFSARCAFWGSRQYPITAAKSAK